jgi:hypothetical protein
MPNYALDPRTRARVTIKQWLDGGRQHQPAECDVCGEEVMPKAVSTAATSPHFAHQANSRCPTVAGNRARFASLGPSGKDPTAGKRIRQEFVDKAFAVYTKCSGLCETLKLAEFQSMVAAADQKDMWSYVGLSFKYVPYLLVSTQTRFPAGGLRHFSFYFVFEPPRRHVDELWSNPVRLKQRIWRVHEADGALDPFDIDEEWLVEPEWFRNFARRF